MFYTAKPVPRNPKKVLLACTAGPDTDVALIRFPRFCRGLPEAVSVQPGSISSRLPVSSLYVAPSDDLHQDESKPLEIVRFALIEAKALRRNTPEDGTVRRSRMSPSGSALAGSRSSPDRSYERVPVRRFGVVDEFMNQIRLR